MPWYALYVQTGQEEVVRKQICKRFENTQIRCLIPKRKIPERNKGVQLDRIRVMFPGYVLINLRMNLDTYYIIKSIPKVYCLLKSPSLQPTKGGKVTEYCPDHFFKEIPEEEIRLILNLINQDEILDYSEISVEDDCWYVRSGPLKEMEGVIRKLNKHTKRVKVAINLTGKEFEFEAGIKFKPNCGKWMD